MKDINVIYEDNHILVVEKPVNVLSQEDKTNDLDMLTILKRYLKKKYNKPGNVFLGLLHRLDRPVGGVMVFAKTSKAASRISNQIRQKEFKKEYLAIICGIPKNLEDRLHNYLLKYRSKNIVSVVDKDIKGAKEAILDYKVLKIKNDLSLVNIKLHTGRPHQIRVQFSAIGNPLLGDKKYNVNIDKSKKDIDIALWSHKISFIHPTKKNKMMFECQLPDNNLWNIFK